MDDNAQEDGWDEAPSEDWDSAVDECGLQPGPMGHCDHAGTEYCQCRCPFRER